MLKDYVVSCCIYFGPSWLTGTQDQIIFPNEAVFEKVLLPCCRSFLFFHLTVLSFLTAPNSWLLRLIKHLEGFTYWSSILMIESSSSGCRLVLLLNIYLSCSKCFACMISYYIFTSIHGPSFLCRNQTLTMTHNCVALWMITSTDN